MKLEKNKHLIPKDFSKETELIDKTIKELNLKKEDKILDVGTGFGAMAILLALNGFDVLTGQPQHDVEWEQHKNLNCNHNHKTDHYHDFQDLKSWEENAKTLGVRDKINFQNFDVEKISFPDKSFDAIFMFDSLQHVKNKERALSQCFKVLKNNGLIFVIEWNKKCVDFWNKKDNLDIDYVDLREILGKKAVTIQLVAGKEINIFIGRKNHL
jgi:2-polyprenyl-3-methyl-5-hydroxy-6-metoxy-1,4-benzoquinol methylase